LLENKFQLLFTENEQNLQKATLKAIESIDHSFKNKLFDKFNVGFIEADEFDELISKIKDEEINNFKDLYGDETETFAAHFYRVSFTIRKL